MVRSLLAGLLVVCATAAAAQHTILVAKPPTYRVGEMHRGSGLFKDGSKVDIFQNVRRGPNKKLYVLLTTHAPGLFAQAIFDPEAWRTDQMRDGLRLKTLESDCSPRKFFPLWVGKVYECSAKGEDDGRVFVNKFRQEIVFAERDPKSQKITRICTKHQEEHENAIVRLMLCYSPDMKWITDFYVIENASREKT